MLQVPRPSHAPEVARGGGERNVHLSVLRQQQG